ncbi:hypothetical protein NMU03_11500 [Allocoprobacillus halotolerans]|uniref:DUF3096 domain-containing protein n=1 Tax=Allocoprobacillus halotolerans TaxID=2944914 RepID=A0ABY5HYY3_9FIRM|nr:hypothetical protein [Allocoprobacillus halotolerans]UTY38299.1 hypothetical protein NMU03_11500 [Allocoprobacillus halotolerans]
MILILAPIIIIVLLIAAIGFNKQFLMLLSLALLMVFLIFYGDIIEQY